MPIFNKTLVSAAIVVLIVLMAALGIEKIWQISLGGLPQNIPTIFADGQGKVNYTPNLAEIAFSVVSEGLTPKQVQDANTAKMNNAIKFIKARGVADKDVQTSGYSLNPKYFYPNEKGGAPFISGYTLTQTITVKVRDLGKVGEIISGVVEQGVNQTGGLNFTVDDEELEKLKQEARLKAYNAAKEKAQSMAKAAGVKLVRITNFSESFFGIPQPTFEAFGKGGAGGAPIPQIEPGSQEIVVSVNITYQIR